MRISILVSVMTFLVWPLVSYCELPDDYVQKHSEKVEAKINPLIKTRFEELSNKTPNTRKVNFSRGFMYVGPNGLVWETQESKEVLLVDNASLEKGYAVSGFVISPDSKKAAYKVTFGGQDLKLWNVVTISQSPEILMTEPAQNRMDEFRWNKNSDGFYYSFFNEKELVKSGQKPITETRFRNVTSGEDRLVFNHELAENFGIQDIDGGKTLVAFRLLNPAIGIKTTYSMYKGLRQADGSYQWEKAYPRNQYVGFYLGTFNNKVYVLSGEAGDNYGVVSVDVLKDNKRKVVVKARSNQVLHTADLVGHKLILQYHSIPEQNVSLEIYNLKTSELLAEYSFGQDFNLTPYGNLDNFSYAPGGHVARAIYSDVFKGNFAFELNIKSNKMKLLKNETDLDFDNTKVTQELVEMTTEDGTKITGRLYTRKDKKPAFVYIRYYGWISIKNSPESKEVQMALEAGGAYFTIDLPGGGERGQSWFIKGSRYRLDTIKYISEMSSYLQSKLNMSPRQVVGMGRSWGGFNSLILAAKYGDNFGMINPVVPVIDIKDMFEDGWFGRISHSDFAPLIDDNGDYVLDKDFYDYVYGMSPIDLIPQIPRNLKMNLLTSGLDDRVDQGGEQEALFAQSLEKQVGSNLMYHRSVQGNHGSRFYQILMFSLIVDYYGITYEPLSKK